jgi:hypothetical protein
MNRHRQRALHQAPNEVEVGIWSFPSDLDAIPIPPNRRRRLPFGISRSDFVWSVAMLSLLVWMTFIALTLWH